MLKSFHTGTLKTAYKKKSDIQVNQKIYKLIQKSKEIERESIFPRDGKNAAESETGAVT